MFLVDSSALEKGLFSSGMLSAFSRTHLAIRLFLLFITFGAISITSTFTSGFTDGPILCLFRNLTGLPCPFCGSTRAVGNIVHGNFIEALYLNPLGYVFLLLLGTVIVNPTSVNALGALVAEKWWALKSSRQIIVAISTISLLWLINMPRLISSF